MCIFTSRNEGPKPARRNGVRRLAAARASRRERRQDQIAARARHKCAKLVAAGVLLLPASDALARAVVMPAGRTGEPVREEVAQRHGWPEGSLDLINHPLRHIGWKFIFGTSAGDQTSFAFTPRTPAQVQTIVDLYKKVAKTGGFIALRLGERPPDNFATLVSPEADAAVVLRIGSQKLLDDWFSRLKTDPEGNRIHGKRVLSEPPKAVAPMLTIYAGNHAVDLASLRIPKHITVHAAVSDQHRRQHPDDPLLKRIDQYVTTHRARSGNRSEPPNRSPDSSLRDH